MKIISGFLKGRNLLGFNIEGTRPTMDRVKESLFSMIQSYIPDSVVLDLFSGSGNLAIEAISNGAKYTYCVDKNKKCTDIIIKNIKNLNIKDKIEVLNIDFNKALESFVSKKIKFDIIFLDPPYKNRDIPYIIEFCLNKELINDKTIIVCEVDDLSLIKDYEKLQIIKNKKYGDKYIVIYKCKN